jgi:FAD/FMN-containing dehydrogenase
MSAALEALRRDFAGDIIEPGATEYESVRRALFRAGTPACVLRPTGVRGVQAAVRFAADDRRVLSGRGGDTASRGLAPTTAVS